MKKIEVLSRGALRVSSPLHVFALFSDLEGLPEGLPRGILADFEGKANSLVMTYAEGRGRNRLAFLGLGERAAFDPEKARRASAVAVRHARSLELPALLIDWSGAVEVIGAEALGRAAAEGAVLANYEFARFKSEGSAKAGRSRRKTLAKAIFVAPGAPFRRGVDDGLHGGAGAAFARDLGNTPSNEMTPSTLAREARKLAASSARITCKVLAEAEMKRLGMGALLGVSRGSREPAKLIHLCCKPSAKKRAHSGRIAVVGKGLTFDSGGISLKSSRGMEEMKFDMCGGAAVLGLFHALAQVRFPREIHGVVAASENMPGGGAQKPGDVVRAMNGKTIEVLNTDAEGRLILADALSYASARIKPAILLDLATLTGAVVTALGHEASGVMGEHELCDELVQAGEKSGERCWELPLWEVHREQMKGECADLKNINAPSDGGGSMAGGAFLANFVGEGIRWAHIDIAGTAWGGKSREYYGGKGASGVGVRLLLEWLRLSAAC